MKTEDDGLPDKFYKKMSNSNDVLTKSEIDNMLKEYYKLKGWDNKGVPL